MAVKLRLTRMGKKKQPFYRIVAADSRARRDGKYIEKIGHYNPIANPAEIVINEQRAFYWLKNGAIPTETVKSLFTQKGIMLKWHYMKHGQDEAKIEEEYKKWELLQLERQKREEAFAEQAKREGEQKTDAEESAPEEKEQSIPEAKQESVADIKEETVESQSEDQASDQEEETPQKQERTSDTQDEDKPNSSPGK
ncbi:MAG: 30S ribosomal protein S16 [bacterium]|nr:MAG: 30S ribosomal protein S16 [bacterium]